METYNEHSYLEMSISDLTSRIEKLEDNVKRLDDVALALLPKGYKKEVEATKKIKTVRVVDPEGIQNIKHINTTYCTNCGITVGCDDMYCRNCGATFIGFSVGEENED